MKCANRVRHDVVVVLVQNQPLFAYPRGQRGGVKNKSHKCHSVGTSFHQMNGYYYWNVFRTMKSCGQVQLWPLDESVWISLDSL